MPEKVPLLFEIDVEPDEHVYRPDDPSPWAGFEAIVDGCADLRARLTELTEAPARFTWSVRIDPQIALAYGDPAWIVDRHRRFFDDVIEQGDAVGVHPHAWRWEPDRRVWFADHADPDWVDRCIEMSFEGYESRFGVPPPHHRFGSRFVSDRVLATVERLGARYDLTLEPGEPAEPPGKRGGGIWLGEVPDQRAIPRKPYHPSDRDYRRPAVDGRDRLWVIPLSAADTPSLAGGGLRLADRLSHPVRSAKGLARRAGRVLEKVRGRPSGELGSPYRVLRLWRDRPPLSALWDEASTSLQEIEEPYLALAIRSDMAPILPRVLSSLEDHPLTSRLVLTTPEDALARLGLLREPASGPAS